MMCAQPSAITPRAVCPQNDAPPPKRSKPDRSTAMSRHLFVLPAAIAMIVAVLAGGCNRDTYAPVSQSQSDYETASQAPSLDLSRLSRRIHEGVNDVRQERNLSPLAWNDTLAAVAQLHSRDMAENDFFSHRNPDGEGPTERGVGEGFSCEKTFEQYRTEGIAENIYYTYPYSSYQSTERNGEEVRRYNWKTEEDIAEEIVRGWMDSPDHRQNILDPRYDREGLGVARASDDRLYVTQNLC